VFYAIHRYSDTLGLAIGPVAETANDDEALRKASQMYETGLANISIKDEAEHRIDGDELLACTTRKKTITEDLRRGTADTTRPVRRPLLIHRIGTTHLWLLAMRIPKSSVMLSKSSWKAATHQKMQAYRVGRTGI
jgi:hypothetical protein